MRNPKLIRAVIYFIFTVSLFACAEGNGASENADKAESYVYQMPVFLDDGWQVGHLDDHGIDSAKISTLIRDIYREKHAGIDSISIVRDQQLLLHEDFRTQLTQYDQWVGNNDLERHVLHSTSKSFVSALVGIAYEQGFIRDLNEPILNYFDYNQFKHWSPEKSSISIHDTLTMRLGIEWDEWSYPYTDFRNSLVRLTETNFDYVKALFDLPMKSQPGKEFTYNTAASIALGALVERASGLSLEAFAEQNLFNPLQIKDAEWLMTPDGLPNTGSGLFLKTRDLAKFGQLYLNGGDWNGYPILSSEWIEASLNQSVNLDWDYTTGYGFQWWIGRFYDQNSLVEFYSSRGFGGQFIIVIPKYDLVIAFTASNYDNDLYHLPFHLVERFILPALSRDNLANF